MKIKKIINRINDEKGKILRFLISRMLWHTGICKYFFIKRDMYRIRFFPTALSASLWLDATAFKKDENLFTQYLKKNDIVIDVGANIGTLTLTASKVIGKKGKVLSFEPDPKIFSYLKYNVELNRCTNVRTYNCAIGEKKGYVSFSQKKSDDQNRVENSQNSHKLPIQRLDDFLYENKPIDKIALLKVDVEGYEKFVFQGAKKLLEKCECIYFETADAHFNKYNYRTKDLLLLLNNSGYEIYKVTQKGLKKLSASYHSKQCENLLAIKSIETFISRTEMRIESKDK